MISKVYDLIKQGLIVIFESTFRFIHYNIEDYIGCGLVQEIAGIIQSKHLPLQTLLISYT